MPPFLLRRFSAASIAAVFAAALCLLCGLSSPVLAQTNKDLVRDNKVLSDVQKRIALVIGNKSYADLPLKNPVNDAQAMAQTLQNLGFEVILKTDLTNRQMVEAVDLFTRKLGPNTIGLFYFSGHGVQLDGTNYLVPVGYHIVQPSDISFETFPAQRLVSAMGQNGCTFNIIILDACRNNPFPKGVRALNDKGLGKNGRAIGHVYRLCDRPRSNRKRRFRPKQRPVHRRSFAKNENARFEN